VRPKTVTTFKLLFGALALSAPAVIGARERWDPVPPLRDPALLNIGFVCRWQSACMTKQDRAMRSSLNFVKTRKPPVWKIQLCNRNASRNGTRKDWAGFNRCIRNPAIRRQKSDRNGQRL
jgi:hypothetical protein